MLNAIGAVPTIYNNRQYMSAAAPMNTTDRHYAAAGDDSNQHYLRHEPDDDSGNNYQPRQAHSNRELNSAHEAKETSPPPAEEAHAEQKENAHASADKPKENETGEFVHMPEDGVITPYEGKPDDVKKWHAMQRAVQRVEQDISETAPYEAKAAGVNTSQVHQEAQDEYAKLDDKVKPQHLQPTRSDTNAMIDNIKTMVKDGTISPVEGLNQQRKAWQRFQHEQAKNDAELRKQVANF